MRFTTESIIYQTKLISVALINTYIGLMNEAIIECHVSFYFN